MKIMQILKTRKGFTLMELIIVMVILALLAAALLPSFLNFVRDARERSLLAEARVGMVAAQVLVTEGLAGNPPSQATLNTVIAGAAAGDANNRFFMLVTGDVDAPTGFSAAVLDNNRVTGITYTSPRGTATIRPPDSSPGDGG